MRIYAIEVVRAANGRISTAGSEPPIQSPHVSEPVTNSPVHAPTCMATSSKTKARVAVLKTNQKCPRTSSLLRFKAAIHPKSSLLITGVDKDQRVNNHAPGTTSSPVAKLEIKNETDEATTTRGAKGIACFSSLSMSLNVMQSTFRSTSVAIFSA